MRKPVPFILALSFLFCAAPAARAGISSNSADMALGQGTLNQSVRNGLDEYGFGGPYTPATGPGDIAIDTTTGRVYVTDPLNNRVLFWDNKSALANGAGASGWLGQPNFYSSSTNRGAMLSCSTSSLSSPRCLMVDPGGNLWVSDTGNNRVLKFNYPVMSDEEASFVLGQQSFTVNKANDGNGDNLTDSVSSNTLNSPYGLAMDTDGTLWVADCSNHRVLGFTDFSQNGSSATYVLGQQHFAANGYSTTSATQRGPRGVAVDSQHNVWVVDSENNRVLRYPAPISNGMTANLKLGQPSFTTSNANYGGLSASSLNAPSGIAVVSPDILYIADKTNNRVVKYNLAESTAAVLVLGQQLPYINKVNDSDGNNTADTVHANTLYAPNAVRVEESGDVWVADNTNYRVLRYTTPSATGADASLVLGQGDFVYNTPSSVDRYGVSNAVSGAVYDPVYGRFFVADNINQRVLWWDSYAGLATHAPASGVLGQDIFYSTSSNHGSASNAPVQNGLYFDSSAGDGYLCGIAVDSQGNVWVADTKNNRVLRYNGATLANGVNADRVIGQANYISNSANQGTTPSAKTLYFPNGLAVDAADNLWVADMQNNRVLRFDYPQSDNMDASRVLGQADLGKNGSNRGLTVNVNTLLNPYDVKVDVSSNVWVVDKGNNRVLKYDLSVSSSDAVLALGQHTFTDGSANQAGAVDAGTLSGPKGVGTDLNGNVWVADTANNRVLRYSVPVATGGTIATYVFGQADFATTGVNRSSGYVYDNTLWKPMGLAVDAKNSVWIVDSANARALKISGFFLGSITPNKGANTMTVSITNLAGGDLQATYDVRLQKTGETEIAGTGVGASGSLRLTCAFDLTGRATGYWDVTVSTGGPGAVSSTLSAAFEVLPMTVTSITPASAGNLGTVSITNLAGYGFLAGSLVKLKKTGQPDIDAANVTVADPGRITCEFDLTGAETGAWDVEVSSDTLTATLGGGFTVSGLSILVSTITPSFGYESGPVNITKLGGGGFAAGCDAKLVKAGQPAISAANLNIVDASSMTCTFDLTGAATGFWDIVVSTGGVGASSSTLAGGFEVRPFLAYAVTPSTGFTSAAVTAAVTGQGFIAGSTVRLTRSGETDIPGTGVAVYASTITCVFDTTGKTTGYWNVAVTTGSLTRTLTGGFLVLPMQAVSLVPSSGANTFDAVVSTIAGQGFVPGSTVQLVKAGQSPIDGAVDVIASTKIVCSFGIIGKTTGYWDVVVSTGAVSFTLAEGFQILPMQIASIVPGNAVNTAMVTGSTITGQGFVPGSAVQLVKTDQGPIDGVVESVTATKIVCSFDIIGKTTGYWDVVVSTGGPGAAQCVLPEGFQVVSVIITSVTPNAGYNSGPVNVTDIQGVGFSAGYNLALVRPGTRIPGTGQTINASSTSMACTFDITGQEAGYWDLVISTGEAGSYSFTLSSGFAVLPMQVSLVTPGSAANTAAVSGSTVTGQGFVTGSRVKLVKAGEPEIPGTNLTVSASSITCSFDISGKTTGYWDVVVSTGEAGSYSVTLSSGFIVLPMQAASITPNSGYNSTYVNIDPLMVQGLVPGSEVKLFKTGEPEIPGTNAAVYASSMSCRFELAGRATGYWDVVVSTGGPGSISCTLAGAFNILPMQITSIATSTGANTATSFTLDVKGQGFLGDFKAKLKRTGEQDREAYSVSYNHLNKGLTCRFNLWAATTGYWDVVVSTGDAGSFFCLFPGSFTVAGMLISSTTPTGAANNNTAAAINIHGQGLTMGSEVKLVKAGETDITATNVTVTLDHDIYTTINGKFNLLDAATGYWDVVVTTGPLTHTLFGGFLVNSFLVNAITPGSGYNTGPVACTVTGVNFPATSQVKLRKAGNAPVTATNVTVANPGTISCTFDLTNQTTGPWDVEVSTGVGGIATATLAGGFTILPLQITSVSPGSAYNYGTTTVTVRGDGFLSGTKVKLFKTDQTDITASNVAVVSSTTILCVFNLTGKPTGYWDVMVATGTSVNLLAGGFEVMFSSLNLTTVDALRDTTVSVAIGSGEVTLDVPAGTFGEDVRMLLMQAEAPESRQVTLRMTPVCYEITNDRGLQPQKDLVLTIHYLDGDIIGMDESRLVISRYDPANSRWIPLHSTVNADENYVRATVNHLSLFAVAALSPANDLAGVRVFPSPYSPLRHPLGLMIDNLPAVADIKLYTVTGEFVCSVPYTDQSGRTTWAGRNESGEPVANGVYIALIKSGGGVKRVKIALEK